MAEIKPNVSPVSVEKIHVQEPVRFDVRTLREQARARVFTASGERLRQQVRETRAQANAQ